MSIKTKLLALTFLLLALASGVISFLNREAFLSDKNAYLYETANQRLDDKQKTIQSAYQTLVDRVRLVLLSVDSLTGQFPAGIKEIARQQQWGRYLVFAKDELGIKLLDYLGADLTHSPELKAYLQQLPENQLVIRFADPITLVAKIYYRQGSYYLYAESPVTQIQSVFTDPTWGVSLADVEYFKAPSQFKEVNSLKTKILQKQSPTGQVSEFDIGGKKWVVALKYSPEFNFYYFQTFDKEKLFAPVKKATNKTLLVSFVILLVGLVGMYLGVQGITHHIQVLSSSMEIFGRKGSSEKVQISTNDEMGSMAKIYNLMLEKIKELLVQTEAKARMEAELETAKEVQETLLPKGKFEADNIYLKGYYRPASECGGDIWFFHCEEDKAFVFVGDATGHGVPAALITAATRSILALIAEEKTFQPDLALSRINKVLCEVAKGAKMMTAFCCFIDLKERKLYYSNASHDVPVILPPRPEEGKLKKNDLMFLTEANSKRLGHARDAQYVVEAVEFALGSSLFIYTDGIIDAKNKDGEQWGERTLNKVLLEIGNKGGQRGLHDNISRRITEFVENIEQPDDITFVTVHFPN